MNYKEFKELQMVKSFLELYQHYFRLFLIAKGYFSKNLSHHTFYEICRSFCGIIHFPSGILESLQAREVGLDAIGIIDGQVQEMMSQISETDIVNAFSQLKAIRVLAKCCPCLETRFIAFIFGGKFDNLSYHKGR